MRPQLALRLIGGGLVLQGLLFYGFATPLTIQIFPGASDEAVHVGMIMRRGLAAMSFLAGLVIFLVRDDGYRTTKRVLFGCGIGFVTCLFSNNGNFGSVFEIFVNVVNSNDCLDFVGGIAIGSIFASFGFSKLNVSLIDFEICCLISSFSCLISGVWIFEFDIFDDRSYNLSSSFDNF